MERVSFVVGGQVQGVGFRAWARLRARELGLVGFARNLDDGRVEVCTQGEPAAVERFGALLRERPSTSRRPGTVGSVDAQSATPRDDLAGFTEH